MPKAVDIEDFAAKLNLLCKRLNWSRARLAQQVGIDKSLAGRWLAGASRPTGNSLMRLNEALAKSLPDFSVATWDAASVTLATQLGMASAAAAEPLPTAPATFSSMLAAMRTVSRFAEDIDFLAPIYCGFYSAWFSAIANDGTIQRRAARIWRDGDGLRFEVSGASANYVGACLIVQGRLFVVLESPAFPGLAMAALGGPYGSHPKRLTGAIVFHTPTVNGVVSVAVVTEFIEPLSGNTDADHSRWRTLAGESRDLRGEEEIRAAVPPEVLAVLRPVVGAARADGTTDHFLRIRPLV